MEAVIARAMRGGNAEIVGDPPYVKFSLGMHQSCAADSRKRGVPVVPAGAGQLSTASLVPQVNGGVDRSQKTASAAFPGVAAMLLEAATVEMRPASPRCVPSLRTGEMTVAPLSPDLQLPSLPLHPAVSLSNVQRSLRNSKLYNPEDFEDQPV